MAKKSFVLSNGDGRVTWTDTGSASINDGIGAAQITGSIIFNQIHVSSYAVRTITNNSDGRFLSASANGIFNISALTGTVNSGALGWNGDTFVATNIIAGEYSGSAAGDLSGSYKGNVKVVNIGNVYSGSLKPSYGGTGLTGSQYTSSPNLILEVSGSGLNAVFSTLSASASGTVVVSGEGRFGVQFPSYKPDVRFYGTPGTYTWRRPIGARFARVILQGAGGGGGGGTIASTAYAGGGGASGGFTDIVIDVSDVLSSSVTVGLGGGGGAGGNTTTSQFGSIGGTTSWNDKRATYSSTGGAGGARSSSSTARSAGGSGLTKNGGGGSATNSTTLSTAEIVYGMPSGGGKGFGVGGNSPGNTAGGVIIPVINPPNKNFGYIVTTDNIPIITTMASGGAGSTSISSPGSDATGYGAGGGGGSANTTAASNGGRGGDGYALIISW